MPTTRSQVHEIERLYFKIEDAVGARTNEVWKEYIAALDRFARSHREKETGWGMSKAVEIKFLAVKNIFEFIAGERVMPDKIEDLNIFKVESCLAAAILIKYRTKILSHIHDNGTEAVFIIRVFLKNNNFLELIRK